ncbi:MAG: potassium channel family protein [Candidatus Competibacter sp.]|nr:potassium channel family protein [Candidatus Competibacter sp.]MDG4583538.1 potassium channel family protein [Candidatus Competibacter sp.]
MPLLKTPVPAGPPSRRFRSWAGRFRYSAVELLAALLLLLMAAPFVETLPYGGLIESILMTLVMLSAVLATGGKRWTLAVALALVTPALAGKWLNHFAPHLVPAPVFLVTTAAFFTFVAGRLIRFILRAPQVDANVLCAGLAGYLMLGLLWVPAYMLTAHLTPDAFAFATRAPEGSAMQGFNAFYFSLITLCTVGYGDVTPVSKVARMLVVMETIAGLFYMAVLISRLVAVYSTQNSPDHAETPTAKTDLQP